MAHHVTYLDVPQRSDEWFRARIGRLTSSRSADMLATIRTGEAAKRRDLRTQLVCERLVGEPQENGYVSKEMQRGLDTEPDALAAYEALTGQLVTRGGFCALEGVMAGCSPDGLIDDVGLLELKCPKSATHLKYLRAGAPPPEYVKQMTCQLWVTGRRWVDFVSYDDRFPAKLRLVGYRLERDEPAIRDFEERALEFLAEVDAEERELRERMAA